MTLWRVDVQDSANNQRCLFSNSLSRILDEIDPMDFKRILIRTRTIAHSYWTYLQIFGIADAEVIS